MDKDPRYSLIFRQEANELLADIENILLELEETPEDPDLIHRLFCSVHTIKGSGAMFGFDEVARFAHYLETVLDRVREGAIPVTGDLIDLVLQSGDQIKAMLNAEDGEAEADLSSFCAKTVSRLQALLPESEADGTAPAVPEVMGQSSPEMTGKRAYRIRFHPAPAIMKTGINPVRLLDELREMGECSVAAKIRDVPHLNELDPERIFLFWDIVLKTEKSIDAIRDVFIFVEGESDIRIQALEWPPPAADPEEGRAEPEIVPAGSGVVASALAEQKIPPGSEPRTESIRISSEKLDILINLVGELVINQARLNQMIEDHRETRYAVPVREIERLTNELREFALDMRMLPVDALFGRFRRLVRDLSKTLKKEIELIVSGGRTELDKNIIERLYDPLLHLIRNSIDHGLRSPDFREAHGKPGKGTIYLTAEHRGATVDITVKDDGMGIDAEAVRVKAVEKGLIAEGAHLTESEIYGLILSPGFSTAQAVSDVSGRGVGMDAVKREISSLGGTIRISSIKHQGTEVRLSLPLTLAIIEGLHVRVDGRDFVLPVSQVQTCEELRTDQPENSGEPSLIRIKGELIPCIRLRDLFGLPARTSPVAHLATVRFGAYRIGVMVDEIVGDLQTVIKPLDRLYRRAKGITGATILGNGRVALIVDLPEILRWAKQGRKNHSSDMGQILVPNL